MSKDSDRAHIERKLEGMMNNDWRTFRAHLVAEEQVEQVTGLAENSNNKILQQQSHLSNMFRSDISSIFHSHKSTAATASTQRGHILNGDTIGGVPVGDHNDHDDMVFCNDPFVSAEELPLLMKPLVPTFDKHRWAHEIPHVEAGSVLIANEMLDGDFHQTVVLIVEHSVTKGSIGVVINRYVVVVRLV
jgi:hypothetical protein